MPTHDRFLSLAGFLAVQLDGDAPVSDTDSDEERSTFDTLCLAVEPDQFERAWSAEREATLYAALQSVPVRERAALALRYGLRVAPLSMQDIAFVTGVTVKRAQSMLCEATNGLRQKLAERAARVVSQGEEFRRARPGRVERVQQPRGGRS